MNPYLTFSDPPPDVQRARLAMARLEQHLLAVIDPLDPTCDLTSLAFAFLSLEDIHPPYPPLPDGIAPSPDPRADLVLAVHHLRAAAENAGSAAEILRYAYTVRDLHELTGSRHLARRGRPRCDRSDDDSR